MPVSITNMLPRPVLLPLSSGEWLRLEPGETSHEIPDVEVKNNPKLNKLQAQRAIGIQAQQSRAAPPAPPAVGGPEEPVRPEEAGPSEETGRTEEPGRARRKGQG